MKKKIIAIIVAVALLTVGFTAIPIMADAAAGTMTHVQLTPNNVTLATGAAQHFTAQALDNNNQLVSNINYFWVVTAGGGTIDNAGVFTAGAVGTYNETVEVIAVQGKTVKVAAASVIVAATSGSVTYVLVTPAAANIAPSGTQQFTAQGYDSNNVAIPSLTYVWAATGAGTIVSSGLFTAGTAVGTASVTATIQGISGTATIKVTAAPTTIENPGKTNLFNMFKGYLKNIGSDNFLGGQWQVKNSSGTTDTYNLISGVVQTVSSTTPITLTVLPNGQTNPVTYTLTASTVIQPKNTTFAANDKVMIITVNNQVTMVSKIIAPSTTQLPPGLNKQGNNDNRHGKDTPPGWSQGKKAGWNKNSSNGNGGSNSNGD
jgi:hypothetical protein